MLWWTAQNVVVTAALAAVVWVACRVGRVGPVGRHALWLVVLAKMVTPPLVAWPWAVGGPFPVTEAATDVVPAAGRSPHPTPLPSPASPLPLPPAVGDGSATSGRVVPPAPGGPAAIGVPAAIVPGVVDDGPAEGTIARESPLRQPGGSAPVPAPAAGRTATPPPLPALRRDPTAGPTWGGPAFARAVGVAGGLWSAGAIGYALLQAVRIARMRRRLRRHAADAPPALVRLAEQVARRVGVRPVPVRVVPGIGSPAVWAVVRPVLLWPAELSPADAAGGSGGGAAPSAAVRGLLAHELAHVRRRDHWVGWLELVAGCAWWWNPLFWYVRHQVRENAELACDGWAVDVLPDGRRAYAEGLIAVCEHVCRRAAPPPPAVGVNTGGRRFLERRLAMILRERVPLRLPRFGLVTVGLLALGALPAWSLRAADGPPATTTETTQALPPGGAPSGEPTGTATTATADPEPGLARQGSGTLILEGGRTTALPPGHPPVPNADGEPGGPPGLPGSPDEVRALMEQHQRRVAESTLELIRGLEAVRDRQVADGHPEAAARLDPKIRQLRQQVGVRPGPIPPGLRPGAAAVRPNPLPNPPLPDPGSLTAYRDKTGQSFTFDVVGRVEGTVWGSDVYTDDSDLGTAAVHAGLARPGERATVTVRIVPGKDSYQGSSRNGVTSRDYLGWPGSFRFEASASPTATTPRPNGFTGAVNAASDPGNLTAYRGRIGSTFLFLVQGTTEGSVWGGGPDGYTDDSALAAAAVHAGAVKAGEQGLVRVTILPGRDSYNGFERNGVSSHAWGSFPGGYVVAPLEVTGTVRQLGQRPAAPPDLSAFRGQPGVAVTVDVVGSTAGPIWGTDVYTDDTSIATAAVHAGVLKDGERGAVRVTILPGRSDYGGSTRNGVTSSDYRAWPGSFRVDRAPAPAVPGMGGGPRPYGYGSSPGR